MVGREQRSEGSELFFGLIGAAGTDLPLVQRRLKRSLRDINYQCNVIKLSQQLSEVKGWKNVPTDLTQFHDKLDTIGQVSEDVRVRTLMDLGNIVRKMFNKGHAVAGLAIGAIRRDRKEANANLKKKEDRLDDPLRDVAFVLNSLKNPAEVLALREVYGPRFFAIAAYCPKEKRIENLTQNIAATQHEARPAKTEHLARELENRDEAEAGESLGQNVRDTFALADVFVDATNPRGVRLRDQIQRFVELVSATKPFHTPTRDEYAMFHAHSASLRSSAPSRQVGAAIVDSDSNILSLGTNEVPKSGGGLYWPGDPRDAREFTKGVDQNEAMKMMILTDISGRFQEKEWLVPPDGLNLNGLMERAMKGWVDQRYLEKLVTKFAGGREGAREELEELVDGAPVQDEDRNNIKNLVAEIAGGVRAESYLLNLLEEALSPVMKGSMLLELTEYSRTVHGEMAALMDAALRGIPVRGCVLYTTTFPCHICTRHIIASGIDRVVYIEPYPKGYAKEQHGDAITLEEQKGKVGFVPFIGIGPRRYPDLFELDEMIRPRRDEDGNIFPERRDVKPVIREPEMSYLIRERDFWRGIKKKIEANWT